MKVRALYEVARDPGRLPRLVGHAVVQLGTFGISVLVDTALFHKTVDAKLFEIE